MYPPSDDTFFMVEAISKYCEELKSAPSLNIAEIGSGSGMISACVLKKLKELEIPATLKTTDKNPIATECTKNVLKKFFPNASTSYTCNFLDSIKDKQDIIIFNPPYVVTEDEEEMEGNGISISWAGGENGREVIDEVLVEIPKHLKENGVFFLCGIEENDPEGIIKLAKKFDLFGEIVLYKHAGIERLWVIKFKWEA